MDSSMLEGLRTTLYLANRKNKRTTKNREDYKLYMRYIVVPYLKRAYRYLSKKYPELSPEEWKLAMKAGRIRI